jgi:hypothetical protein
LQAHDLQKYAQRLCQLGDLEQKKNWHHMQWALACKQWKRAVKEFMDGGDYCENRRMRAVGHLASDRQVQLWFWAGMRCSDEFISHRRQIINT